VPQSGALVPAPEWYYTRDRQRYGPIDWEQLRKLAARGALRPNDLVWRRGSPQWLSAVAVPGLYPGVSSPPPTTAEPAEPAPKPMPVGSTAAEEKQATAQPKGRGEWSFGTIKLSDFRILKKLGAGAMGAVYLARQRSQDRLVALKVLSRHLSARPLSVQRFNREAEIMAQLEHAGIVRLHGAGTELGLYFLAMDYVDGCSAAVLSDNLGTNLPVGDALYIVIRCAEALRHAHERHRIVHRDVKPTNILINHLGYVKLTDLGLAKPLDEEPSLTESGICLGTPEYMAPEQMRNAKYADQRSDIYALGGVLYRLLTGIVPFHENGAGELLLAKEMGLFPPARRFNQEVPPRLNIMLDRMLSRDVRNRYQNYEELLGALLDLGLAHEHLSFNLRQVTQTLKRPAVDERVEILLIDDDAGDTLLVQEGLDDSGIPSNLNVVADGEEALAFLNRQGKHAAAPRPHLIFLGCDMLERAAETVAAIKRSPEHRHIPFVVLTTSSRAVETLRGVGVQVNLKLSQPGQLPGFQEMLNAEGDSTVTVVELFVG
jgi:serine/threonine protein kinase